MRDVWFLFFLVVAGYGIGQLLGPVLHVYLRTRHCEHINVRCVHGDEINIRETRAICRACGKALKKMALPEICSYTLKPHFSFEHVIDGDR